jgi:hypothetical protein
MSKATAQARRWPISRRVSAERPFTKLVSRQVDAVAVRRDYAKTTDPTTIQPISSIQTAIVWKRYATLLVSSTYQTGGASHRATLMA